MKGKGEKRFTYRNINTERAASENVIGDGKEGSLVDKRLGSFQESKPIRVGKRGW
jgi:hypothetical protein